MCILHLGAWPCQLGVPGYPLELSSYIFLPLVGLEKLQLLKQLSLFREDNNSIFNRFCDTKSQVRIQAFIHKAAETCQHCHTPTQSVSRDTHAHRCVVVVEKSDEVLSSSWREIDVINQQHNQQNWSCKNLAMYWFSNWINIKKYLQ